MGTANEPTTTTANPTTQTCNSFADWSNTLKSCSSVINQCVHLVKTREYGTCRDYCASLPGHTCFYAAEESSNRCLIKEEKSCDTNIKNEYSTSDMLCGCAVVSQNTNAPITTTTASEPTTTNAGLKTANP